MNLKEKSGILRLTLAALFMALGMVLPMLTMQIKEIGDSLLPMHIPVLLCGLICGWQYGLSVGFILPFLRSFIFSMPPMYPNAVWMAFELATYGFMVGFLYSRFRKQNTATIYLCLISAMVVGRIIWGIAKSILLGVGGKMFTLQMFVAGGVLDAIPGIVIQLILIPLLMGLLRKPLMKLK